MNKKMFNKNLIVFMLVFALVFSFTSSNTAHAATNPSLGAAESFSILAQTAITGISTITGDVGMNRVSSWISALTTANVTPGTIYATDAVPVAPGEAVLLAAVQADASTAYTATIPGLPIEGTPIVGAELNGITRGPGVYDLVGATITLTGGSITLDGPGTYIFRVPFILTTSGAVNLINGARACDVFWNVGTAANINGTSFAGTILSSTGVHFGPGVTLDGRALAIGADVTLGVDGVISGPTCEPYSPPSSGGGSSSGSVARVSSPAILHVIKQVVNNNGGFRTASYFNLHVTRNGLDILGSPAAGVAAPGIFYSLTPSTYMVSESQYAGYTTTFSGDCDSNGNVVLSSGDEKTCTVINDDIATSTPVTPIVPMLPKTGFAPEPTLLSFLTYFFESFFN